MQSYNPGEWPKALFNAAGKLNTPAELTNPSLPVPFSSAFPETTVTGPKRPTSLSEPVSLPPTFLLECVRTRLELSLFLEISRCSHELDCIMKLDRERAHHEKTLSITIEKIQDISVPDALSVIPVTTEPKLRSALPILANALSRIRQERMYLRSELGRSVAEISQHRAALANFAEVNKCTGVELQRTGIEKVGTDKIFLGTIQQALVSRIDSLILVLEEPSHDDLETWDTLIQRIRLHTIGPTSSTLELPRTHDRFAGIAGAQNVWEETHVSESVEMIRKRKRNTEAVDEVVGNNELVVEPKEKESIFRTPKRTSGTFPYLEETPGHVLELLRAQRQALPTTTSPGSQVVEETRLVVSSSSGSVESPSLLNNTRDVLGAASFLMTSTPLDPLDSHGGGLPAIEPREAKNTQGSHTTGGESSLSKDGGADIERELPSIHPSLESEHQQSEDRAREFEDNLRGVDWGEGADSDSDEDEHSTQQTTEGRHDDSPGHDVGGTQDSESRSSRAGREEEGDTEGPLGRKRASSMPPAHMAPMRPSLRSSKSEIPRDAHTEWDASSIKPMQGFLEEPEGRSRVLTQRRGLSSMGIEKENMVVGGGLSPSKSSGSIPGDSVLRNASQNSLDLAGDTGGRSFVHGEVTASQTEDRNVDHNPGMHQG
ncbi:hypothetical protein HK104_009561 [Borealophlyctis nickersoniae]|nr:hypothetical protein HK104_009561 [Borealophlyctis nickersoniae]